MAVYVPIVATRAFSIGQAVFHYVERLVGHDVVLRILEKMRTKLYGIVEPQALFFRSRFQTGDMLGVLSEDIEHLQNLYLRTIFPSILALVVYSIFVLVIGTFDVVFALIAGVYASYYRFSASICIVTFNEATSCYFKTRKKPFVSTTNRCCFGLSDWQASGRKDEFIDKYVEQNAQLLKTEKRMKRWNHIRDSIIQLVVGIVVIAMIIWTGNEAASEQIAPTVIAAFVLMTLSVTNALIPLSDAIDRIPSYVESAHRLNQVEGNVVFHRMKRNYLEIKIMLHQNI
ncbi:ABC transporter transmembrane domain-containing protein [Bacillus pacificus]